MRRRSSLAPGCLFAVLLAALSVGAGTANAAGTTNFLFAFGGIGVADTCTTATGCFPGTASSTAPSIITPAEVAYSGGEAFVTNAAGRVDVFDAATGAFKRSIGSSLSGPFGVALSGGELFVSETFANRVRVYDATTGAFKRGLGAGVGGSGTTSCTSSCAAGTSGTAAGQFRSPYGIAVSDGRVFVVDQSNNRVDVIDATTGAPVMAFGKSVGGSGFDTCTTTCVAGVSGSGSGQFSFPHGGIVVAGGEAYVTDMQNNRVEVFDASTGAFKRALGANVGGAGTTACTASCVAGASGATAGRLTAPVSAALSGSGELLVSDQGNSRVDVVDASTGAFKRAYGKGVGGSGADTCTTTCSAGIPGGRAGQFDLPAGLALTDDGRLLAADAANNRVMSLGAADGAFGLAFGKAVQAQGFVCTTASGCSAGLAAAGAGEMDSLRSVAVIGPDVFVGDLNNNRVDVFNAASGVFQRAFGRSVNSVDGSDTCTSDCRKGAGTSAAGTVNSPLGLAASGGEVFVAANQSARVDVFAPTGAFKRALGGNVGGSGVNVCTTSCNTGAVGSNPGQQLQMSAVTAGGGSVYVADAAQQRVTEYDATTGALRRTIGTPGSAAGQLQGPQGMTVSGGELYVADSNNRRVSVFDAPTGAFKRAFGLDVGGLGLNTCTTTCQAGSAGFSPLGVSISAGRAYVVESAGRISAWDPQSGALLQAFGSSGSSAGAMNFPWGLTVAGTRVFVADMNNHRVDVFDVSDTTAPATTDNVPAASKSSPVTVTLDALDAGSGVGATYYTKGTSPATPTTSSSVYNPNSKPTLNNGEKISYFSVDNSGNIEPVHTSAAVQIDTGLPSTTDDVPAHADHDGHGDPDGDRQRRWLRASTRPITRSARIRRRRRRTALSTTPRTSPR